MTLALLAAAVACFSSFIWSILRFFRGTGSMKSEMRLVKYIGLATMAATLAAIVAQVRVHQPFAFAALFVYATAFSMFWAAYRANAKRPLRIAFTEGAPGHFVDWGPYRWIRHPFYTSYILAWIAGPLASSQGWLLVPGVVLTYLYVRAARLEERQFGESEFAAAYEAHRLRTGMFWPVLPSRKSV